VLAVVHALGADAAQAAMALTELQPPVGRGERTMLNVVGGQALLIDESYNANPASMRAALGTLGSLEIAAGRRIAVLGDMKELGDAGPELHRGLAEAVEANRVDLVFAAGALMRNLVDALPAGRVAAHAANSADLVEAVAAAIRPGDAVMVKGSLSTRMGLIVEALKQNFYSSVQVQAAKG
jgi:UDP-N-acetylmuramoyl-tripeptide--D-alanyl-D-alanine ligase